MAVLKIKSSALIEIVIAMLLLTVAFSLMMVVQLKLYRSSSFRQKAIAMAVLNNEKEKLYNHTELLIDKKDLVSGLTVERQYKPLAGFQNMMVCSFVIYSDQNVKLLEHKCLITLK